MKANTYIVASFTQEVKAVRQQQVISQAQKFEKFKEFRQSYCDMFTTLDFYYYADETGLKYETIKRLARYARDEPQRLTRPHWLRYQNFINRI